MNSYITRRQHPLVAKYTHIWEKSLHAYKGSLEYIHQALIKHTAEPDISFEERKKRAYYFNYPRKIARIITQYALATEPVRNNVPLDIVKDFSKDRLNANELMRQCSTMLNILGCVWLKVDMPYFVGDLTLERKQKENIRPFAEVVSPLDVTDYSYDESGSLNWCIVRDRRKRYDEDPFVTAVEVDRYTLYTRDYIRIYESDSVATDHLILEVPNQLGIVPVFRLVEVDGYGMKSNHYFEDVVRISDAILNNESEAQMNIIKQMFGILVVSDSFINQLNHHSDEKSESTSAIISRSTSIVEEAEEKGITRYISPAGVETSTIRSENKALKEELYDIVGMALNSSSKDTQTAESKSWDFQTISQFLETRADLLEQAENHLWELFKMYDSSIPKVTVVYSRDFAIKDLQLSMQALVSASSLPSIGIEMNKQIQRSALEILENVLPVDEENKTKILDEIENLQEVPSVDMNWNVPPTA